MKNSAGSLEFFFHRVMENYLTYNRTVHICLLNWQFLIYLFKMEGLEKNKTSQKNPTPKQNLPHLTVTDIFIACLLLLLLF